MALVKEKLWKIVSGAEREPEMEEGREAFQDRRDRAVAILVLSIHPSLLYIIGEPTDPKVVWEALEAQFQRKSWVNRLELERRLFELKMVNDGSMQTHVKEMTELLDETALVVGPVDQDSRVVHLLASLPRKYDVLVTALEAGAEVPKWAVAVERLLHEERKLKSRAAEKTSAQEEEALAARYNRRLYGGRCFGWWKAGAYPKTLSAE